MAAATAAAAASAVNAAAEAKVAPLPFSSTIRGYCNGGETLIILET